MTPREAVEFFATKIEQQAKVEKISLTEAEKLMLRFSEVESDGVHDVRLAAQFENEDKTDEFEEKMSGLLVRAYEHEQREPAQVQQWKNAKDTMLNHDYYIWCMIWSVFPETGPKISFGKRSSLKDYLIYTAIGLAIVATLVLLSLNSR